MMVTSILKPFRASVLLQLAVLFSLCFALTLLVHLFVPITMPMPDYWRLAELLASGAPIPTELPPIYIWMIGISILLGGPLVFLALQFLSYYLAVCLAFCLLRVLRCRSYLSFTCAALVACHPYLWSNTHRVLANAIAVPALLATCLIILYSVKNYKNLLTFVLLGVTIAFIFNIRGNFIFIPCLIVILIIANSELSLNARLSRVFIFCLVAALMHSAIYYITSREVRLMPNIANYNFFLSANPFTSASLLETYNIEPSLDRALDYYGITIKELQRDNTATDLAWSFIINNPLEYLSLFFLKAFTLFRPDYRMLGTSQVSSSLVLIVLQSLIALPLVIWLGARMLVYQSYRLFDRPYVFILVALYLAPCVILGADPRYRLPTDILMIVDVFYCIELWKQSKAQA